MTQQRSDNDSPSGGPSPLGRLGAAVSVRLKSVAPSRWLLSAGVLGAFVSAALLVGFSPPSQASTEAPRIKLLGQSLQLDAQSAKTTLEQLRHHLGGLFELRLPEGQNQKVSFGDLGVLLDKGHLVQLLRDAGDPSSPLSRVRRRQGLGPADAVELTVPLALDQERTLKFLRTLKAEYDRPARDARLDLNARKVIPSVDGLLLDLDASQRHLAAELAAGKTSAELVFERVAPQRRTEQLSGVRFDHVLAAFETSYDRSARSAARTHNLRVAASKLDGYVLLPGEIFDFNRVVGARDETNGYKVATVIAQGELVDGIGGGTCQISGTLHGAAFFGGLEVVERYPHTRPSSYIKLGLDATVVYPTINYRVQNPHDFPVVLHQTVKNGVVRAELLGPPSSLTTTLIRRIEQATPYEELERPDPSLPAGRRVLAQRGVPGFKVRLYRIVRNGPHAIRERWLNRYPPTTQIVRVGSGGQNASSRDLGDRHPEYTADELLVVTHTVSESQPATEPTENREPGRFGMAGWTREAGMPVFSDGD